VTRARSIAGEALLHPLAVGAVALLAFNDHWAKAHLRGVVTGKLSDFAGLIFFPLLLQALVECAQAATGRRWQPSLRVLLGALGVTVVVFASVKTWTPAAEVYRVGFGLARWPVDALVAWAQGAALPGLTRVQLARDATDLIALPGALLGLVVHRARLRNTLASAERDLAFTLRGVEGRT
jgi:hypothetical protein